MREGDPRRSAGPGTGGPREDGGVSQSFGGEASSR